LSKSVDTKQQQCDIEIAFDLCEIKFIFADIATFSYKSVAYLTKEIGSKI